MPRASAPLVSSPRRFHDRPVGRLAGAARPRPFARHAGDRGRTDRRGPLRHPVRRSRQLCLSRPLHRARVHRRSRAWRRGCRRARFAAGRRRGRGDRRPAAALRRHRVLSDDGGVRAGGAAEPARPGAPRARSRAGPIGARPARAPGEQFHQPGI